MSREFDSLSRYRKQLSGRKVRYVTYHPAADEGLKIIFEDGTQLLFGFSGEEGDITIWSPKSKHFTPDEFAETDQTDGTVELQ